MVGVFSPHVPLKLEYSCYQRFKSGLLLIMENWPCQELWIIQLLVHRHGAHSLHLPRNLLFHWELVLTTSLPQRVIKRSRKACSSAAYHAWKTPRGPSASAYFTEVRSTSYKTCPYSGRHILQYPNNQSSLTPNLITLWAFPVVFSVVCLPVLNNRILN